VSALLFKENDAHDLSEKILRLAQDSRMRETIGKNAFFRFKNNFDGRIMVEKVDRIYKSLIERAG